MVHHAGGRRDGLLALLIEHLGAGTPPARRSERHDPCDDARFAGGLDLVLDAIVGRTSR
jgi:hypothetical protein